VKEAGKGLGRELKRDPRSPLVGMGLPSATILTPRRIGVSEHVHTHM
jgi:hypothetical protein